jgi:hypothetical protein
MASRWMQSKLAIMAKQRKFTPSSTHNRGGHSLAAAQVKSAALAWLCDGYSGVVTVAKKGKSLTAIGKSRRAFNGATYGDGRRRGALELCGWNEAARFTLIKQA